MNKKRIWPNINLETPISYPTELHSQENYGPDKCSTPMMHRKESLRHTQISHDRCFIRGSVSLDSWVRISARRLKHHSFFLVCFSLLENGFQWVAKLQENKIRKITAFPTSSPESIKSWNFILPSFFHWLNHSSITYKKKFLWTGALFMKTFIAAIKNIGKLLFLLL